ncbi:unnamed protein product, partial [Sphacelaria rigidula]
KVLTGDIARRRYTNKHARAGVVNARNKICGYEGCSALPTYSMAGSTKVAFCSKHARAGMMNVVKTMCGYEGCPTLVSYGTADSKKAEVCSQHARAEIVKVKEMCGYE